MGVKNVEFGSEYSDIAIKKLIKKGLLMRRADNLQGVEFGEFDEPNEFESLDDLEELEKEWSSYCTTLRSDSPDENGLNVEREKITHGINLPYEIDEGYTRNVIDLSKYENMEKKL